MIVLTIITTQIIGYGPKLFIRKFWNVCAVFCFIAAYPELYAAYTAEELTELGNKKEAREHHMMSGVIRIARGFRLLEYLLVSCLIVVMADTSLRVRCDIIYFE